MDVFTAMKGRQSVRKFRKDPVPREKLLKMEEVLGKRVIGQADAALAVLGAQLAAAELDLTLKRQQLADLTGVAGVTVGTDSVTFGRGCGTEGAGRLARLAARFLNQMRTSNPAIRTPQAL